METGHRVDIAQRVRARLLELQLLLDDEVSIRPILNWGGFVNWSFAATDARTAYHVKLVDTPESVSELKRWMAHGRVLSERYRAPTVQRWIKIPGTPLEGLVLEWIAGVTPEAVDGDVRRQAINVAAALHSDTELADALRDPTQPSRSCADAFVNTFGARFADDLAGIRAEPPPFVDAAALEWMTAEADRLVGRVLASRAFSGPVQCAIHGDLWLNNLMVQHDGTVRIVDWDDLRLGDPMMDWATLLGPTRNQLSPARLSPVESDRLAAEDLDRLALYAKATMLDWVIDPLADWVEARRDPAHVAEVRAANEDLFHRAIHAYRLLDE